MKMLVVSTVYLDQSDTMFFSPQQDTGKNMITFFWILPYNLKS